MLASNCNFDPSDYQHISLDNRSNSELAADLILTHHTCRLVYNGVFGADIPERIIKKLKDLKKGIPRIKCRTSPESRIKPYDSVGDIKLKREAGEFLKTLDLFSMKFSTINKVPETLIEKYGERQLWRFHNDVVLPNVIDPSSWALSNSATVLLYAYCMNDFEQPLFNLYGERLSRGIVLSINKYRMRFSPHPFDHDLVNFDITAIFWIFSTVAFA